MASKIKPHIYLISSDTAIIEQFVHLGNEYQLSYDEDGRLLKRLKYNVDNHNIALIISDFDFFKHKINKYFHQRASIHLPVFIVLADTTQATALASDKYHVKYLPVYLPVDFEQLKSIITALLHNRQKIISSEEKKYYKHLYHKAPVIQFLIDPLSFRIVEANRAAARLFGRNDESELTGQPLEVLIPDQCMFIREKLIESSRLGECSFTCTFTIPGNGSMDFAVFVSKIAIRNRFLLFLNFSDITYSKNTERILTLKNIELQKTNSELDNFVYSTSHELRAPLMSVLGLINLFETETCQKAQKIHIDLMKESITKLDKIIHDIVDYARNARSEIAIIPIDFSNVLEKVRNSISYMTDLNKVDLRFKIDQPFPFHSDYRRVEIILKNLIANGIKFHSQLEESPFVEVEIVVGQTCASIKVHDNGKGITEDHMPKIFEMFFRGDEFSTGSGIGLYIVKEIIEKINGTITVESSLNKGTTINIELPNQYIE